MTTEIRISSGQNALVDDIDADLANYRWCKRRYDQPIGYAIGYMDRKSVPMHVVILQRILGRSLNSSEITDHINGNTLDNRRCNLRAVNGTQQAMNRNKVKSINGKPTSSIYKGVNWSKYFGKWRATIKYKKHKIHLLYTTSEIEAAHAYDKKARELYGEFAKTNFD